MKIMYVIHSLVIGGAETIVTNYLIELKKIGADVVLVQMTDKRTFLNQRLEDANVRVITANTDANGSLGSKLKTVREFRKIIRKENPDILHVHTGLEKFRYISYPENKMVFTLHSAWERSLAQGKNHRRMLFKLIQKGMMVVALSEKAKEDVLKQFPGAKVCIIPNGFDFQEIQSRKYNRSEFLSTMKIPESAFVLGHVGRFHKVKNHEKIIEIFKKVIESREDAHLLLVGGGTEEDIERIQKLVKKCGIVEKVHFLGERKDAVEIMSTLDCMILPSYSEAFSLTLIEAQILNCRCVTSTGVPEEVCCNEDCLRLGVEETAERWAEFVLDTKIVAEKKEIRDFEIKSVLERHLELYSVMDRGFNNGKNI